MKNSDFLAAGGQIKLGQERKLCNVTDHKMRHDYTPGALDFDLSVGFQREAPNPVSKELILGQNRG